MSTLRIFKNCRILPEANFSVDDLEIYLGTLNSFQVPNFQYIKHSLNLKIKVILSQDDLKFTQSYNYNYIAIKNGELTSTSDNWVYYFIVGKKWTSSNCIELDLLMDTINSFMYQYVLSDRTRVLRQHKDRFIKVDGIEKHNEVVSTIEINKNYYIKGTTGFNIRTSNNAYPIELKIYDQFGQFITRTSAISIIYSPLDRKITTYQSTLIPTPDKVFEWSESYIYLINASVSISEVSSTPWNNIFGGYYNLNGKVLKKKIDFYSEGLNPILYQKEATRILDKYDLSNKQEEQSFYLIYKNRSEQSDNSPVDVYLCGDDRITLSNSIVPQYFDGTLNIYELLERSNDNIFGFGSYKVLMIEYGDNNSNSVLKVFNETTKQQEDISLNSNQAFILWWSSTFSNYCRLQVLDFNTSTNKWSFNRGYDIDPEVIYNGVGRIRRIKFDNSINTYELLPIPSDMEDYENLLPTTPIGGNTIYSIRDLDRTLSTLIKIIKLPYSPIPVSQDENGNYLIDATKWTYDTTLHMLKLRDGVIQKFNKQINLEDINPFEELSKIVPVEFTEVRLIRSMEFEPKLLHSDYYQPKIIYDSFSFSFQLEKVNNYPVNLSMNFIMTTTMNSRFMFTFSNYDIIGKAETDYYNIMPIARNNEVVLYNSDYLNYIRTGFNYDVKTKQRQEENTIVGSITQGVGAIGSFIAGMATNNPLLVASGISLATSLAVNAITTANSIAQQEQNIQAKLLQTKMQSIAVAGSDDVDLMTEYTDNNKAKYCIYEISEKLKEALFHVFFYTGYIADFTGLPNTTSRKNFNFVSADVVFMQVPNLPSEITEDIKNKYKVGITFLHRIAAHGWDFEQQFENWEVSILN